MRKIVAIALLCALAVTLRAAPVRDGHVTAELLTEATSIAAATPFWVGVRLVMDPQWHTYWSNPGDSGYATRIDWTLPEGFRAGAIQWPYPERFQDGPLVTFGYSGEIVLLVEIVPPSELPASGAVRLAARMDWLMCKEACIPGGAQVAVTLPLTGQAGPLAEPVAAVFQAARARLPREHAAWTFSAVRAGNGLALTLRGEGVAALDPARLQFFPAAEGLFDVNAASPWRRDGDALQTDLALLASRPHEPERVDGTLVVQGQGGEATRAVTVQAALGRAADDALPAKPAPAGGASGASRVGWWKAIWSAFLGGLLLNLMPCVFPVISLKILGFVQQAGSDRRTIWRHGLAFGAGVLASFWALAGVLLVLKATGSAIGWGFQLQHPPFVAGMAILFLLFSLNLFGVFEIGTGLTGVGAGLQSKRGLTGSFFSGVLATIVATPCTAPFMGLALGFALTQPAAVAMAVFTSLALGMATPYLLLSRYPAWLSSIPRPGPWMETLKQFLGFLLFAFVLYLVWVFAQQRGEQGLARILAGLLAVGLAGWTLGRWGALSRPPRTRLAARVAALGLVAGGVVFATARPVEHGWIDYSPELVAELQAQGRPFFIDFTAAWCVTCQVNKRVALHDAGIEKLFIAKRVTRVRADWTDRNARIAEALAAFGRSGVPFYVLYPGGGAEPVTLPEILTPGLLADALGKL